MELTIKTKIVQFFNSVALSVVSMTAESGVMSSIPAQSHTFVEIDHERISTAILHLPLIQKGLLPVTRESICTKYWLTAYS